MKLKVVTLLASLILTGLTMGTAADSADEVFTRKFLSYKAKNKISALKTAELFAQQQKKTTEQVLNRFISAQWVSAKNSELAVIFGLEAFLEQGLSYEEALTKVSDLTGQMTTTLQAMHSTAKQRRPSATAGLVKKKSLASR